MRQSHLTPPLMRELLMLTIDEKERLLVEGALDTQLPEGATSQGSLSEQGALVASTCNRGMRLGGGERALEAAEGVPTTPPPSTRLHQ